MQSKNNYTFNVRMSLNNIQLKNEGKGWEEGRGERGGENEEDMTVNNAIT